MKFFLKLFKRKKEVEEKYRIVERGNGQFSAQEKYWNGWRDLQNSMYQSVCYDAIQKRIAEDKEIEEYLTIKRVIPI
jgi:hypothetical protein